MIENIKFKYIVAYILFIIVQLVFLSPKMVVGINVPILFTYLFDLFNHRYVTRTKNKINYDTSFIAILLSIASIVLIFADVPFWGTSLLIMTIALLWRK